MVSQSAMREFGLVLAERRARAQELRQELQELEAVIEIYEKVLDDAALHRTSRRLADEEGALHLGVSASDLEGCATHGAAWIEIAKRSGGYVCPREAAYLFVEAGLSGGNRKTVISNSSKRLSPKNGWERVAPGLFRWLGYEGPVGLQVAEIVESFVGSLDAENQEESEWGDECSPISNGDKLGRIFPERKEIPDGLETTTD